MNDLLAKLSELSKATGLPSAGEYWSKDNAKFEGTDPSIPNRIWRSMNPMTALGSAMGSMHDAASTGDLTGATLATADAVPFLAALKLLGVPGKGLVKASTKTVPTIKKPLLAGIGAGLASDAWGNTESISSSPQKLYQTLFDQMNGYGK